MRSKPLFPIHINALMPAQTIPHLLTLTFKTTHRIHTFRPRTPAIMSPFLTLVHIQTAHLIITKLPPMLTRALPSSTIIFIRAVMIAAALIDQTLVEINAVAVVVSSLADWAGLAGVVAW